MPVQKLHGLFLPDIPGENKSSDLAEIFCEMDDEGQAAFFNKVAYITSKWPTHPTMQWRYMETKLSKEGSDLIKDIFEHTR